MYSLIDTNATNISIVYCRGNRDAVLIKTIHAWPLIWRHLCKCIPANNYHLDGLNVVMDLSRWHCNLSTLIFLLIHWAFPFSVAPSLTRNPGSGELVVKKGSTVSLKCQATGFPSPKVFWQNTIHLTDLDTAEKKNWMKGDQGFYISNTFLYFRRQFLVIIPTKAINHLHFQSGYLSLAW